MKYNPTRWVCQFPARYCDGYQYVYGQKRPCPLAHKCLDPTARYTPYEYPFKAKRPNQRVLSLSEPERYLTHAKRSCDLRRVFLAEELAAAGHEYYMTRRDILSARNKSKYQKEHPTEAEVPTHTPPCGGDCANCPYDDGCHHQTDDDTIPLKRPGPPSVLAETDLRQMIADGLSAPLIASRTGCKSQAIRARCKRLGIKLPPHIPSKKRRK